MHILKWALAQRKHMPQCMAGLENAIVFFLYPLLQLTTVLVMFLHYFILRLQSKIFFKHKIQTAFCVWFRVLQDFCKAHIQMLRCPCIQKCWSPAHSAELSVHLVRICLMLFQWIVMLQPKSNVYIFLPSPLQKIWGRSSNAFPLFYFHHCN